MWFDLLCSFNCTTIRFFVLVETPCGGTFNSEGVIYSPNFPGFYPHNQTCRTLINAPNGMVINFIFFNFFVACNDSLVIYDGSNESSPFLADLGYECGYDRLGILQSSGQNALLVFQSDQSETDIGFRILVQFRPGITHFIMVRLLAQCRSGNAPFQLRILVNDFAICFCAMR